MNKYEQIIDTLIKRKNSQKWEYITPNRVPNVLKRYGTPDKVYKTELAEDLYLYLYTVLENRYNEDFDHCYAQENIYCSLFNDAVETDTFGTDNVYVEDLRKLLHIVQNNIFDIQSKLDNFLNCN